MAGAFLKKIINGGEEITREEFFHFLGQVAENRISSAAAAAFLASMSAREISGKELLWFAQFIHGASPRRSIAGSAQAVNIVGTGGGLRTFNISTAAAFVASAAGATVIKSGSYRYNSGCGSLDVLKALGLSVAMPMDKFERMVGELNLGFVNPDYYSPVLKRIAIAIQPLRLVDIGGFINNAGPLLCPIEVGSLLVGVSRRSLLEAMGSAAEELGYANAAVCWSELGMDELSSIGNNHVLLVGERSDRQVIGPDRFGFTSANPANLAGGDPRYNAEILKGILKGTVRDEKRDTVVLNSAYMLYVLKKAKDVEAAVEQSLAVLENGLAYRKLEDAILFCKAERYQEKTA